MTEIRKPMLKRRPSGKFTMHEFQREDISVLLETDANANWSEMGCMKTSTAEWLWDMKLKHIPNPRVLVITTKSGKGTYLESLPEVLPHWDVFVASPQKNMFVVGSKPVPVAVNLPNPLYMRPVVALAHYHCFTNRACKSEPVKVPFELPNGETKMVEKLDPETGLFEMTNPKCAPLLNMHWDLVVLDEAHRIKNHDAQWTHNIKRIKAQHKHIMTGTGFINNPAEVWSLLNFLYPTVYTSYWKFVEKYCDWDDFSGYRKISGIKPDMVDEFRELIHLVGVRRHMRDVFPEIEEPIETVIEVELNPTQKAMYRNIRDELLTYDQQGVPLHSPNVLSALNRLRQICVATPEVIKDEYDPKQEKRIISVTLKEPSSKLDAVMEVIEGLQWDAEEKQQIVVFSNFRDPLELLKVRLEKAKIPHLHMRSELNENQRYEMWHNEWPKKEHQVFLCTLAVGSESINLSSAERAIMLDQSWSPKDNSQAIGRIYRPGQTGVAQIIYIRAEDTVDYRVLDTNQEKMGWFRSIFGGQEEEDDVEEIEDED